MTENKATRTARATTNTNLPPETLANPANPQGDPAVSTGKVGDDSVIEGQEHVLGDDPRRVAASSGFHDSLTGRPVTEDGRFTEEGMAGQGPIPKHRIVSDSWPTDREAIDDPTQREGNTAK